VKFNGDDNRTTWEHISQYIAQLGEAIFSDALYVRLFSLSFSSGFFFAPCLHLEESVVHSSAETSVSSLLPYSLPGLSSSPYSWREAM
jgi:hypothetical protein